METNQTEKTLSIKTPAGADVKVSAMPQSKGIPPNFESFVLEMNVSPSEKYTAELIVLN